jgi:ribonuclease HI
MVMSEQHSKISILQHNTWRKTHVMHSCLEIAIKSHTDFVLIQEPWIASDNTTTISHAAYYCILPNSSNTRPRVAIFARKQSKFTFCHRTDLTTDSDIIIIDVSEPDIETFQIINIYNEKALDSESNQYTVERSLQHISLTKETLIAGDFNSHHYWWNSSISNSVRAESLILWLEQHNFELINEPDVYTYARNNGENASFSVIDLSFATKNLSESISDWHIDEENASGSDHEIIKFNIRTKATELVENPLCSQFFNYKKADWKKFSEEIQMQSQNIDFSHLNYSNDENDLNAAALQLQSIINAAAEKSIAKIKFSENSKPWWSEKLTNLRKNYSHNRRKWKNNQASYTQHAEARNQYFQEIKLAKQQCWNNFLENADSDQVFKAYKYCKQRKLEKTPIIQYNGKKCTTFTEKCEAFLTALFPNNSATIASLDFENDVNIYSESENNQCSWPELTKKELEQAIFTSSIKKAPGPDKISFSIIQKAYLTIPNLFLQLYSKLIKAGFHPECWKDSIGVVIKKFKKDDYSLPKSYRVVSLLNCLGKISEKIIAERLSFFAETTNLLYFDQIGGRKQKSAIDAAITLLSDIEIKKHEKKITSALLLDVKGAFDHVNKSQLLEICKHVKLSPICINWIQSFCQNRRVQLKFDGEIMKSTSINIGIPQGSPVSPILYLIYISQLFKCNAKCADRMSSYIDDIGITVSSKTIQENCIKLQQAAEKLINWGNSHGIQFDMDKTELIHFSSSNQSLEKSVQIMQTIISPKEEVKWLGIWFDRKLSFKTHVEKRIAAASRMFHSISRLANTERGLSFQAMRKLYIACIVSVADYGVPVWWKNQLFLLDKFKKLQNSALRKILGAFRTSPVSAMEIEAGILPVEVRFEKLCKNYALRILYMHESHPVKQRIPAKSPFSEEKGINLTELNLKSSCELANWNQSLSYLESESESEHFSQRKKKSKIKKQRKFPSQLFRLCSYLKEFISNESTCKIEQVDSKVNSPWQKIAIETEIDSNSKIIAASNHRIKISAIQQNHSENIIIYSDGSKLSETQAGAGSYISYSLCKQQSFSWCLNSKIEAFDAELIAMLKSLQEAKQYINSNVKNIWIFTDNQAAIQRIYKNSSSSGQKISHELQYEAELLKNQNIQLHICWVPGHADIYGNEQADKAAKIAAAADFINHNIIDCRNDTDISLTYIKSQIKKSLLQSWCNYYKSAIKGSYYQNLNIQPAWKPLNLQLKTSRIVWSSYMQLKLGHGYFKSYLNRLPDYNSDKCDCDGNYIQSPAHLLLECSKYQAEQNKMKEKLQISNLTLKLLLTAREGIQTIFDFLKNTEIVRRNWILT